MMVLWCLNPLYSDVQHDNFGGWLELDGVNDYTSIADNSTLDIGIGTTEDFTIECFFFLPDLNGTGSKTLIFKNASYGLYLVLSSTAQDRIIFRLNFSPLSTDYYYTAYFVDLSAGWHHIAASYDNEYSDSWDAMQVFLDGTKVVDASNFEITPGIYNSTGTFYVGSGNGVNTFYQKIDEVRISDILRYFGPSYTVPLSPFSADANTRALWHFDETSGSTTFFDQSENNNTLSSVNGAQTLPVELTSFSAKRTCWGIELVWNTATELNNHGFDIERKDKFNLHWTTMGFTQGHGTSSSSQHYIYIDKNILPGEYTYRLKQIDLNGNCKFSKEIEIVNSQTPTNSVLLQNYPNPFNPSTIIEFQLPTKSFVTLKIYDILGNEIASLVNEEKKEGMYSVQWDASRFPSGMYFYRLENNGNMRIKPMVLMK